MNRRLVRVNEEEAHFAYKDYRKEGQTRELTLDGEEFARRFLTHVLPRGFVRIRHYGLLANRGREEKLRLCRRLLLAEPARRAATGVQQPGRWGGPGCGQGEMRLVGVAGRAGGEGKGPGREDS